MNKAILLGRITKDPELRFAAGSGTAVSRFTIAINRPKRKDQEKAEVDFINCVAFGKRAETISQYFQKGSQIAVSGRIQTGSYEAKDGTKRYTTDVMVDEFDFVGSNKGNNTQNNELDYGEDMTPVDDGEMPF